MRSIPRLSVLAFVALFSVGAGVAAASSWPLVWRLALAAALALTGAALAGRMLARPLQQLAARLDASRKAGVLVGGPASTRHVDELAALAAALDRATVAAIASESKSVEALTEMLRNWSRIFEGRDPMSAGHGARVAGYAAGIAEVMGRPPLEVEQIRMAGMIHDIGKTGIPDSLLNKPGALSEAESEMVKRHPLIGRKLLDGVDPFVPLLAAVELHHENFDGTGYPWGLRGAEIPLAARIIRVADAFDAMTTDRHYHSAMTAEQAIEVLRQGADTQFDPSVVEAFLRGVHRRRVIVHSMPEQLASLQEGISRQGAPRPAGNRSPVVISIEGGKPRQPAQAQPREETVTTGAPANT